LRKITPVILLLVFFIAQYEKHLGYANCQIFNYFKTDGNKCDCEQLLEEDSDTVADNTPPVHIHHHPDESYIAPVNYKAPLFSNSRHEFSILQTVSLSDGNWPGLDRPPQKI
jgi:hypothetical protein